jgi:hypothetical protein
MRDRQPESAAAKSVAAVRRSLLERLKQVWQKVLGNARSRVRDLGNHRARLAMLIGLLQGCTFICPMSRGCISGICVSGADVTDIYARSIDLLHRNADRALIREIQRVPDQVIHDALNRGCVKRHMDGLVILYVQRNV